MNSKLAFVIAILAGLSSTSTAHALSSAHDFGLVVLGPTDEPIPSWDGNPGSMTPANVCKAEGKIMALQEPTDKIRGGAVAQDDLTARRGTVSSPQKSIGIVANRSQIAGKHAGAAYCVAKSRVLFAEDVEQLNKLLKILHSFNGPDGMTRLRALLGDLPQGKETIREWVTAAITAGDQGTSLDSANPFSPLAIKIAQLIAEINQIKVELEALKARVGQLETAVAEHSAQIAKLQQTGPVTGRTFDLQLQGIASGSRFMIGLGGGANLVFHLPVPRLSVKFGGDLMAAFETVGSNRMGLGWDARAFVQYQLREWLTIGGGLYIVGDAGTINGTRSFDVGPALDAEFWVHPFVAVNAFAFIGGGKHSASWAMSQLGGGGGLGVVLRPFRK